MPLADLIDEVLDLVREDAERFGCVDEVENARDIIARGTSAQSQRAIYQRALADGGDRQAALYAVVDWLIEETVRDL